MSMPELPPLRLCLKNTFLEVIYDGCDEHCIGEQSPECGAVVTVGMLEGSPKVARSRSAGCTPRSLEEGWTSPRLTSPQLKRLNSLLYSCADRRRRRREFEGTPSFFNDGEEAMVGSVGSCGSSSSVSLEQLKNPMDSCSTAASEPKDYCHKSVPHRVDLRSKGNVRADDPTTLMIRNVPNCYTQGDLLSELEDLDFGGKFDFAYLPLDKCSKASVGYAFVNFVSASLAARFMEGSRGHRFTLPRKNKEMVVSVAHLQGLAANLEHYESRAIKSSKMALQAPFVSVERRTS